MLQEGRVIGAGPQRTDGHISALGRGFGHLAFRADDIYEFCENVEAKGLTIFRPPYDGKMAFIKTPDGISIEIIQRGGGLEPREPWASRKSQGAW